jgi:hypothetical protein
MHWSRWVIITAVCVLALYIYSYRKATSEVEILQSTLQHFTFDMLREKQPIIIDDRVVKLDDLAHLWFRANINRSFQLEGSETWHKNAFKYMVFHAQEEGDIYVYPAAKKMVDGAPDPEESLVAVHLQQGQIAIIPYRWRYLVMPPLKGICLGVHDYLTFVLPS